MDINSINHPSRSPSPIPEPSKGQSTEGTYPIDSTTDTHPTNGFPGKDPIDSTTDTHPTNEGLSGTDPIDPTTDTHPTNKGLSGNDQIVPTTDTQQINAESGYTDIELNDEDPTKDIERDWNVPDWGDNIKNRNGNTVQFNTQLSRISNLSEVNMPFSEKYFSWRYVMAVLIHLCFIGSIFMRNCMPIALVCMADPRPESGDELGKNLNNSSHGGLAAYSSSNKITSNSSMPDEYEFHWDLKTQGLILSGVQFSSCFGPLLLDVIRIRFGTKMTLNVAYLAGAALTIFTPVGARLSPWVLFIIRVLLGIALGANVTTTADLLSWWSPAMEKQTMASFSFAGVNIGNIITSLGAGFLCSIPVDNGWPFIFYAFGLLILFWVVAMHFLLANKPEEHKHISEKECNHIMTYRTPIESGPKGKPEVPPYRKIFTSIPVIAFLLAASCQVWTTNLYFTYLPNFMVTVDHFTVSETGILMSLVSAARFLGIPLWTAIINKLRRRGVSNTMVKKIILTTCYAMCGVCQAIIMFLDARNRWLSVGLFMVIMASQSGGMCVITVMPMDMAPRYAGFISGLFYSLGSLVSITGPLIVAALTTHATPEEWRIVWIIVICVYVTAILLFVIFCDAAVQPWARVHRDSRPNIQSPFVAMGRRMSAVLDGPMTPNSKITSGVNPQVYNQMGGVSMSPRGSDLSNEGTADRVGHSSPREGVVNFAFQPDSLSPDMIDRVSHPELPDLSQEAEMDGFKDLKFIDDLEDSEGNTSQADNITRF